MITRHQLDWNLKKNFLRVPVGTHIVQTSRSKSSSHSLVLGQECEFWRLDKLLLAIRADDLGLVEIPFVCPRVEL